MNELQDLERRLRAVEDRHAITDCLHGYTRGVDRLDMDAFFSAYHPDAEDHRGTWTGSAQGFLDWWLPDQPKREVAEHYLTNIQIEIDGDEAHTESYFMSIVKLYDDDELRQVGGRYVDRLERRDGKWGIVARVVVPEWTVTVDASEMKLPNSNFPLPRRDRSDISYQRPLVMPEG
jgi:hypothetical protein